MDNQNYIRYEREQYDQQNSLDSDRSNPFKPSYGQSMFIIKHQQGLMPPKLPKPPRRHQVMAVKDFSSHYEKMGYAVNQPHRAGETSIIQK